MAGVEEFHKKKNKKSVKRLHFVNLNDSDTVVLRKTSESVYTNTCVIDCDDTVSLPFRLFKNNESLAGTLTEVLTKVRKKLDLNSGAVLCDILIHIGKLNFHNPPGSYEVSYLMDNSRYAFLEFSKKELNSDKLNKKGNCETTVRFDLNINTPEEQGFKLHYTVYTIVKDGMISVANVDDLDVPKNKFSDLRAGPGCFCNYKKSVANIDIVDPATGVTTRLNVNLYYENKEYSKKLNEHIEILRKTFFDKIVISNEISGNEMSIPNLPDDYSVCYFKRSERNDYDEAESHSNVLRIVNNMIRKEHGTEEDLADIYFIHKGIHELFQTRNWNVDGALNCLAESILYSSEIVKCIFK